MKITDIKATTVTVPLEARSARQRVPLGTICPHDRRGRNGRGHHRPRRNGRRRRIGRGGVPGDEVLSSRPRSGESRGDAIQDRQPDRLALQQPHADPRRARIRLPRHTRAEMGRSGLRYTRRQASDRKCRSHRICFSAMRIRRPARARSGRSNNWSITRKT